MGLILDLIRLPLKLGRLVLTGNVRGLVTFLLGLALLGALWEFTLVNLSSQATATGIMTQVGAEVLNPALESSSFGLSQSAYTALEQQAAAHPDQSFAAPGVKVSVPGSAIAGKSFVQGTQVYYQAVAEAYYQGGASAVFTSPAIIGEVMNLPLLPQGQTLAGAGNLVPGASLLASLGLSLNLLTAAGHAQVQSTALWFGGVSLILLAALVLLSKRWARLSSPGSAVMGAALPGAVGIGVVWYLVTHNPVQFAPYSNLLHLLAGAVVPTYVGAFVVGALAVAASLVGRVVFKTAELGVDAARAAVPAGAAVARSAREMGNRGSGGAPYPGSGYSQGYGQGSGQAYRPEYQRPAAPSPAPYADPWPGAANQPTRDYPPAAPTWPTSPDSRSPATPQYPQYPQHPSSPAADPFEPNAPVEEPPFGGTQGGGTPGSDTSFMPPRGPRYGAYGTPGTPPPPVRDGQQYAPRYPEQSPRNAWDAPDDWPPRRP